MAPTIGSLIEINCGIVYLITFNIFFLGFEFNRSDSIPSESPSFEKNQSLNFKALLLFLISKYSLMPSSFSI